MKKCPHCGTIQQPSRQTCIDCGRVLPEAEQSAAEEYERSMERSMAKEFAWDFRSPYFRVAFVFGIISLLLLIFNLIFLFIFGSSHNVSWCAFAVLFSAAALVWVILPCSDSLRDLLFYRQATSRNLYGGKRLFVSLIVIFTLISAALTAWFLIDMPLIGEPGLIFSTVPWYRRVTISLS